MNPQLSALNSLSYPRSERPSVHLHIERLVLDGLPVSHHQGALVQAAIETELTRLLAEGNLGALPGGAVPHLRAASIQLTHDSQPAHLGHQIAQAIHSGLKPAPAPPRLPHSTGGAPA
jgi:hypothetical protein